MIERFRYHAFTTGVSGRITHPFDEIIPVQASLALPETGGFGTVRVDRFDFRGILSFESAQALVAGSFTPRTQSFDSVATVTVTGLNILGMVTADRIVARIASSHPPDPERGHSITAARLLFRKPAHRRISRRSGPGHRHVHQAGYARQSVRRV